MGVSDTTEKDWEEHYKELLKTSTSNPMYEIGYKKGVKDFKEKFTTGLEEGIRCAMCTNPMHNDRGCDGGCRYDKSIYKEVLDVIYRHMEFIGMN